MRVNTIDKLKHSVPNKTEKKKKKTKKEKEEDDSHIPPGAVFLVHLYSGLFVALGYWVAYRGYSINLISDPANTLLSIWVITCPVIVCLYSCFRHERENNSFRRAAFRGIISLPAGALMNACGAIVLGAPTPVEYLEKTFNWSFLMSAFTFAPAAAVYGSSSTDWHRIYGWKQTKETIDYMICLPAYGAVIGAWLGALPMPLDWERPWQEWPICVTYGAIAGYVVGCVGSWAVAFVRDMREKEKEKAE
ncbi:GPI biosynthesis protein Pig-F [Corchorus capsularis]|uniref:GPI biosynthesis protein Pig-F n=1 Tax=Corchorus capsularis TaxID=210143 RepID=A0A1R3IGP1_COCAP|nr:GPI biosynthesis protein Pig-F [Corchorus capsularis]